MILLKKNQINHDKGFFKEIEPKHWLFGTFFSQNISNLSLKCLSMSQLRSLPERKIDYTIENRGKKSGLLSLGSLFCWNLSNFQ